MNQTPNDQTRIAPVPRRTPAPFRWVVNAASSVKVGIWLLAALFVYAAVGSAGHYPVIRDGQLAWSHQMLRQLRPFEMTEFEWFHTWVFIALCAAICVNLTVVTVRKIPLTLPKLGVWMIHTGIVILAIGSVVYFATKVEGDAPVIRRQVQATLGSGATVSLPALARAERTVPTPAGPWTLTVSDINPEYTLLSGPDEGTTDFAVTVRVTRPDGATFFRQLLDDHPELTEDALMADDPAPGQRPMQRVRNIERFGGEPLFDDTVAMSLEPLPQQHFWVRDSWAIAVRDADTPRSDWSHRPLEGMPRYNDYIERPGEVYPPPGVTRFPIDPISVPADPAPNDAFPDLDITVTGYLRYAAFSDRWRQGSQNDPLNPVVRVLARVDAGSVTSAELIAFDAQHDSAFQELVGVEWVNHPDDLAAVQRSLDGPVLDIRLPKLAERLTVVIDDDDIAHSEDAPFAPVRDTGFAYRVRQVIERLQLAPDNPAVSMAEVEFRTPEGDTIRRWVFADPRLTTDVDADRPVGLDTRIDARFVPAGEEVVVAVSPVLGVRILTKDADGATVSKEVGQRQFVPIAEGVELAVADVFPRAVRDRKPAVVPVERRQQQADKAHSFAMAKVRVALKDAPDTPIAERWIPFHAYSFDDEQLYTAGLGVYRPEIIELPDGRRAKLIFTRQRRELPTPVALEDFHLRTNVGGFTGDSLTIRDWVSELRFARPDHNAPPNPTRGQQWGPVRDVRVNHPQEVAGMWYFQSFWDAPREDPSSGARNPGMAFTGLGVGNREGVYTALAGSTLSVIGMIWAFYVKPVILRRRRNRVYQALADEREIEVADRTADHNARPDDRRLADDTLADQYHPEGDPATNEPREKTTAP